MGFALPLTAEMTKHSGTNHCIVPVHLRLCVRQSTDVPSSPRLLQAEKPDRAQETIRRLGPMEICTRHLPVGTIAVRI